MRNASTFACYGKMQRRLVDFLSVVYKIDPDSDFSIDRRALVIVRVRTRRPILALPLAICFAWCGAARAAEPERVDPFLQAAQWAEESETQGVEAEAIDLGDNRELVACGDEVGMAGQIERDQRRRGRWTVLTELTTLVPDFSWGSLQTVGEQPLTGPRLSLGWESSSGLGIRGRGWGFDSGVDVEGPLASSSYPYAFATPTTTSHEVTLKGGRLDLDLYKRIEVRKGYFAFGVSATAAELKLRERYLATQSQGYYVPEFHDMEVPGGFSADSVTDDLSQNLAPGPTYFIRYDSLNRPIIGIATEDGVIATTYQGGGVLRNRGYGFGLLSEGEYRFHETERNSWALIGRGRLSWLLGPWEEFSGGAGRDGDGSMTLAEGALGIAYRRSFSQADLIVQCSLEAQSWDAAIADRISLLGVTSGVGVCW